MKQAAHRAFTVVELLVVISIITLLIAMLQPSLRSARESARQAICGSQSRQLAIAFTDYVIDNRRFPGVGGGGFSRSTTAPWVNCETGHHFNGFAGDPRTGVLFSYAHDPLVFRCPNDDGRDPYFPNYVPQTFSYTLPWYWEYRKGEDVTRPSQYMLLLETGHSGASLGAKPDDGLYFPNMLVHDTPTNRHFNISATAVMGDTHVEFRDWNLFSPLPVDYFVLPPR